MARDYIMENFELIKDNASLAVNVAGNFLQKLKSATGIVITRETPERVAINTLIEEIKKSAYDPLMKAALISNSERVLKEYINQNNIVKSAIPLLTSKAKPESINDDWLLLFTDKVRLLSDNELQIIWSKILAEECNEPGSISKQLLMILAQMDKVDAETFASVCNFSLKVLTENESVFCPIIDLTQIKTYYSKFNITFENLRNLVALGLIDFEELTEVGYSLTMEKPIVSVSYGDKELSIPESCFSIGTGSVILKKTGKELFNIVTINHQESFIDEVVIPYFNRYWVVNKCNKN